MTPLYQSAGVPVRDDLADAHRTTIEAWAAPGNWWSGTQRLAIVGEVRRARAADELPPWIRPTTVDGLTDPDTPLPDAAVDVVWRLTNHSGTLTADWHADSIDNHLSAGQYVELVGLVATANCLDVFAQALGIEPLALPGPVEGQPDNELVPGAEVSTHWVPTLNTKGANVAKALSSVPVAASAWRVLSDAQYVPSQAVTGDLSWTRGALDRRQVELLAARTSLLNECFY